MIKHAPGCDMNLTSDGNTVFHCTCDALDRANALIGQLKSALLDALKEGHGVGSGGVYFDPALSPKWHAKHRAVIEQIAVIDDHPLGRNVTPK